MIVGGSALGQKRPTSMPIDGVTRPAKMLSRKQVAALIKKQDTILDDFMEKENFYQKIP
jgi:hypothetical protein